VHEFDALHLRVLIINHWQEVQVTIRQSFLANVVNAIEIAVK